MDKFEQELKNIFTEEKKVPEQFSRAIQKAMTSQKKTKNKRTTFKWVNVAAALVIAVLFGVATPNIYAQIKWNIEYKEFENRPVEYGSASIKKAIKDGYEKNIDMEYVYHDNIGVRLDSLMITDEFFSMNVDFIFPKETEINTESFSYGYAVYDENKNVYGVFEGGLGKSGEISQYWKKFYKEENIDYNSKAVFAPQIADSMVGARVVTSKDKNIIAQTSLTTPSEFPKSKKLYIRIFNIGYTMFDYNEENPELWLSENFKLTEAEWKLEVEVPESFYQRQNISLKLAEEIDGFELKKLSVTETGTSIIFKMDGFLDLVMSGKDMDSKEFHQKMDEAIYISDETGKRYSYLNNDNGTYRDRTYRAKFDINKSDLNKKFYLHFTINGEEHKIELVEN